MKSKLLGLNIEPEVFNELKEIALKERVSISEICRRIIYSGLNKLKENKDLDLMSSLNLKTFKPEYDRDTLDKINVVLDSNLKIKELIEKHLPEDKK